MQNKTTHTQGMEANSQSAELINHIIQAATDVKGSDITVLDVKNVFQLSDNFVIISGRSDRHVQGIANKIEASLADLGIKANTIEGYDKAHWVLLDYGDVLVHIFYDQVRKIYDLEDLWNPAHKAESTGSLKHLTPRAA